MFKYFALIVSIFINSFLFGESSDKFILRSAMEGEAEVLYELISELALFEGNSTALHSLTKENLQKFGFEGQPYFYTEFAEMNGEIIGYALYYYGFSANRGFPILYLEDLYVKQEYRGQGIGSSFLKKLARYAKQKECCRLEWHVYNWNDSAIEFYKKIGGIFRKDLIQVRIENDALERLAEN